MKATNFSAQAVDGLLDSLEFQASTGQLSSSMDAYYNFCISLLRRAQKVMVPGVVGRDDLKSPEDELEIETPIVLPYPVVAFEHHALEWTLPSEKIGRHIVLGFNCDDLTEEEMELARKGFVNFEEDWLPGLVGVIHFLSNDEPEAKGSKVRFDWMVYFAIFFFNPEMEYISEDNVDADTFDTEDEDVPTDDYEIEFGLIFISRLARFCKLMQSPGVVKQELKGPKSLNERRIKQGLTPFDDYIALDTPQDMHTMHMHH